MPASWRRLVNENVDYIVVDRDEDQEEAQAHNVDLEDSMAGRPYTKRQAAAPEPPDVDSDSDDEDDFSSPNSTMSTATSTTTPAPAPNLPTGLPAFRITMTLDQGPQATSGALADTDPTETIIVDLPPPPPPGGGDRDGKISQTTEHLLIAAGSIGATIIVVMIILALYTMRKRGLSFTDVIQHGKYRMRRGPPPPPSKYPMDHKQYFDEYACPQQNSVYPPQRAASLRRSSSSRSQRPLQALGRSDSFGQGSLDRSGSQHKSFYDDTPSRTSSHCRKTSATPSSPVLPVQGLRRSASSRNTRSVDDESEELRYPDDIGPQRALPPPPTFRQFLSNRPSISQRPGFGGAMASRFSWTNSNAPQTPHDVSRDTAAQPVGRDSFMTQRSSVPRFRTVDSWVHQQSTRVEEQRLKQQFRMTQSSTSSGGGDIDTVPEMPSVPPQHLSRSASTRSAGGGAGGLAGKDIKHARHDTATTVQTAPIFRAHPGTEVRFSVRSAVPSEVLDMGRKNAAL